MDKFPEIETSRLLLRKVGAKDIPKIIEYAGNVKIAEMTLNLPHPYQEKDAIFWINSCNQGFNDKTQYTFCLADKDTNEFMGGMGLHITARFNRAEMGYWVAEPFWNKGYATEAMEAILKFGFEKIGLNKIYAVHLVENGASGKVMIKNGMIKEGELKEHTKKGDDYASLYQYRLTRNEYQDLKGR